MDGTIFLCKHYLHIKYSNNEHKYQRKRHHFLDTFHNHSYLQRENPMIKLWHYPQLVAVGGHIHLNLVAILST